MRPYTLHSVLSLQSNDPWWSRFSSPSVISYAFNFLPLLSEVQAKLKVNCRIKYPSRLRDLYNKEGFLYRDCITDLITLQLYSFTLDFHVFVVHALSIYKTFILQPLKLLRNIYVGAVMNSANTSFHSVKHLLFHLLLLNKICLSFTVVVKHGVWNCGKERSFWVSDDVFLKRILGSEGSTL
jgi:hypothetical protein